MDTFKGPSLSCTGESLGIECNITNSESTSTELAAFGDQKSGNNQLTEVHQNQVAFVFQICTYQSNPVYFISLPQQWGTVITGPHMLRNRDKVFIGQAQSIWRSTRIWTKKIQLSGPQTLSVFDITMQLMSTWNNKLTVPYFFSFLCYLHFGSQFPSDHQ